MKTEVIFRKIENAILAVFPYEIATMEGMMTCYARIGQHSSCCPEYYKESTKPAAEYEYAALKRELEGIGYDLKVITRVNWAKYTQAYKKVLNR